MESGSIELKRTKIGENPRRLAPRMVKPTAKAFSRVEETRNILLFFPSKIEGLFTTLKLETKSFGACSSI